MMARVYTIREPEAVLNEALPTVDKSCARLVFRPRLETDAGVGVIFPGTGGYVFLLLEARHRNLRAERVHRGFIIHGMDSTTATYIR
jgi:hypothetical protein